MKRHVAKFLCLLIVVGLGTSSAFGQEQGGEGRSGAPKRKKIEYGVEVIKGKIVKPQVQFIISRERGSTEEALALKESFLPKILDSVHESPF